VCNADEESHWCNMMVESIAAIDRSCTAAHIDVVIAG
jgi:hypothetical protein